MGGKLRAITKSTHSNSIPPFITMSWIGRIEIEYIDEAMRTGPSEDGPFSFKQRGGRRWHHEDVRSAPDASGSRAETFGIVWAG